MIPLRLACVLLAVAVLRALLPPDTRAVWALGSVAGLPVAASVAGRWPALPIQLFGGLGSAAALVALSLLSPELWLQTCLLVTFVLGCGVLLRSVSRPAAGLALGLGLLSPLVVGLVVARISPSSRSLMLGALGEWSWDFLMLQRLAQWSAVGVALVTAMTAHDGPRWLGMLAGGVTALVVALRVTWVVTTASLPTDALIWSEPPLLVNLLKLNARELFYGPMTQLNSYSYSPALEHLQYGLLRPLGLTLSLRAHRLLGVIWQLAAALCWLSASRAWLELAPTTRFTWLVSAVGLVLSSLLAPHLHPDHLLMLMLGAASWLVTRDREPTRLQLGLLVLLPIVATMVKLTGAGIGLGLVLAYAWERDWRRLALLALSGALALSSIGLFDATLGNFSDYAIRLQASHPLDWDRLCAAWQRPPLLLFFVGLLIGGWRWWRAPRAPAAQAAMRVALLTAGIGLTSLAAYGKHGGRDNSLLPFTLGGALTLLLALSDRPAAERTARRPVPRALAAVLAVSLALVTPVTLPALGETRMQLLEMHETATAWLQRSARSRQRVFTMSTAAYIDAGLRSVPEASLATISELDLAGRPEASIFERRVRDRYYDGLFLSVASLRQNPTLRRLEADLQRGYVVVAPPELAGTWPSGLGGYVIVERRAASAGDGAK